MSYKPVRTERWMVTKLLVDTALGREKADFVIRNVTHVNVYTGELLEGVDIAIKGDRIALVGNAEHTIGNITQVLDARGLYAAPGFLDGHVHIESSMLTVTQFARVVVPRGTTGVFADPHEIANVLGLEGIRLMMDEARNLPLKVYICIPSCVPASTPELETAGAAVTAEEVEEALGWEGVVALGEVMNYPGVLLGDEEVHRKIQATLRAGKPVEGHSPGILNAELAAYTAAGPSSCHEETRSVEAVQRLRMGMYAMMREGSGWRDLHEVVKAVTVEGLNPRRAILVSDDRHPEDLIREGHMDYIIRRAIEEGVDPVTAIQMATLNTAEHYRLDHEIGGIAPGRKADVVLFEDLRRIRVRMVVSDGMLVAKDGVLMVRPAQPTYPERVRKSVRLKRPATPEDFTIKAPVEEGTVKAHVIGVEEGKAVTKHLIVDVKAEGGVVDADVDRDVIKVAVLERHKRTGNMGLGLVRGFGIRCGAVASTVAHDSHNLIVMGVDSRDMAYAVNRLAEVGGGMIAVKSGETLALLELPIAGLMSEENAEAVSQKVEKLQQAWRKLGCTMKSPFMNLSLLALPVIPEIRITDKGIVDVKQFKTINLFL